MSHLNSDVTELCECVACGSNRLKLTLDLGTQPLANSFKLNKDDVQAEYPLAINRCEECYHVQLTHSVNPRLMFEDYLYVSGTAKTMHQHFIDFAFLTTMISGKSEGERKILDIGCNDGTQLDYFAKLGYKTYGVDPARNLLELSSKNHFVYCDWFNENFAKNFRELGHKLDIITAQNVFAHGPDPLGFLKAAAMLMDEETTLYIQTSQADMIINNEFDTIYHEHISFFNTKSMKALCERAGLNLFDVHFMPIHGRSYIFCISKNPRRGNVEEVIANETAKGLYRDETYVKYAARCDEIVKELVDEVEKYRQVRGDIGYITVGYGAPAKGMTLLNYSGLQLDFIIDDNQLKQNRYTPGSSIPIYSADKLDQYKSAICFVPLAWNFFNEIMAKIKSRRDNHDDVFVTYFPKVETRK